jgi:hypothetical protein
MAAVLGPADNTKRVCASIDGVVVCCNVQLVISGEMVAEKPVKKAAENALLLPVGGAFHSNDGTSRRVRSTHEANSPICCPVYQNVTAAASPDLKPDYYN